MQKPSTRWRRGAVLIGALAFGLTCGAQAATATYTYDGLGRVTSVTTSGGVTTYSYDAAGNRTSQTISTAPVVATFSQRIAVNSTNNPLNLQVASLLPYTLGYSGGPSAGAITISGQSMTYTAPSSAGTYTFQYTATNTIGTSAPAGTVTLNVDTSALIWDHFSWSASTIW